MLMSYRSPPSFYVIPLIVKSCYESEGDAAKLWIFIGCHCKIMRQVSQNNDAWYPLLFFSQDYNRLTVENCDNCSTMYVCQSGFLFDAFVLTDLFFERWFGYVI